MTKFVFKLYKHGKYCVVKIPTSQQNCKMLSVNVVPDKVLFLFFFSDNTLWDNWFQFKMLIYAIIHHTIRLLQSVLRSNDLVTINEELWLRDVECAVTALGKLADTSKSYVYTAKQFAVALISMVVYVIVFEFMIVSGEFSDSIQFAKPKEYIFKSGITNYCGFLSINNCNCLYRF